LEVKRINLLCVCAIQDCVAVPLWHWDWGGLQRQLSRVCPLLPFGSPSTLPWWTALLWVPPAACSWFKQNNLWCTRPGRILTLPSLPYNGCSTNPPPPRSCTLRRPPLQPKQSLKVSPTTRDLWDQRPTDGQTVIVKVSQPLPKFPHCLIHKEEGRRCKSKEKHNHPIDL